jgi:hypothetical protein
MLNEVAYLSMKMYSTYLCSTLALPSCCSTYSMLLESLLIYMYMYNLRSMHIYKLLSSPPIILQWMGYGRLETQHLYTLTRKSTDLEDRKRTAGTDKLGRRSYSKYGSFAETTIFFGLSDTLRIRRHPHTYVQIYTLRHKYSAHRSRYPQWSHI